MSNVNQGYSSKSTAIRGAKRAGFEHPVVEQREDGKWYVVTPQLIVVDAEGNDVPEQNDPTPNEDLVEGLEAATPQPELDDATKEKIAELHKADAETTLRLAAKFAVTDPYVPSTPEQIEERRAERREKHGIPAPTKTDKAPSYKEMARSGPEKSEIEKPVQYIHEYLAEHYGKRSRKDLIAELVAKGINVATCRTQYQHFKRKFEEGKAE